MYDDFFPKSLITGNLQKVAALDSLALDNLVTKMKVCLDYKD